MSACRYSMVAIALLIVAASGAAAQPVFDCTQAKTSAEKAICGNPELSKADGDMSAAYSTLSKNLPAEQKAGLLANQRQWLKDRNATCAEATDDALANCLLTETKKRRAFLVGEADNGPAGAPPLLPAFFDEAKKGAYEITVAYPQFAPPTGAKFNLAVQELTIAKKTLANYRQDKPNQYNGSSNFYQVTYDVTYLAPRLAAVTFQFADYQGGAHPNNWRAALSWDVDADREIALADFLVDPKVAVPAISAVCKDKLAVEAKKEGWDFFDKPDFAAVVGDAKNWSVAGDGVTIMFDPYSVAAYVVGPRDCRLTYAELKGWLKPDGALPPSR